MRRWAKSSSFFWLLPSVSQCYGNTPDERYARATFSIALAMADAAACEWWQQFSGQATSTGARKRYIL